MESTISLKSYIYKEIVPLFFSTFCVLGAVLLISQLTQLVNVIVAFGFSLENLLLPLLFILVPFLGLTIPIAYLFAVFLAFSRFSADGEVTGMLAAGYPIKRTAKPVILVGIVLFVIAATCSSYFEAWGRRATVQFTQRKTKTMLDNLVTSKLQPGVFLDNFLGYTLYAEKISKDRTKLSNVILSPGPNVQNQKFVLIAPEASIAGRVKKGYLEMGFGEGVMYTPRGNPENLSVLKFNTAKLDLLRIFGEQIFGKEMGAGDYRSLPPAQLFKLTRELIASGKDPVLLSKANYLFHQRIATPFVVIVFGIFGVIIGVTHDRKGRSNGYMKAMATVVAIYLISMGFKWATERGYLPAVVGAWLPNLLLLAIAMWLLHQKNRLPPSESVLNVPLWFRPTRAIPSKSYAKRRWR